MTVARLFVPRAGDGGTADAATIAWARAVRRAFLSPDVDAAVEGRAAAWLAGDRLRGSYEDGGGGSGEPDPTPLATLRSWDARLSVPGGDVDVDAVTGIGVHPSHRRRGLLRGLLTADLTAAAEAGTPVAALTSTQGPLYERFGFGAATWTRRLRVDAARARWRDEAASGTVAIVDADTFVAVAPAVAERARRRHPGSMSRLAKSWAPLATGVTALSGMSPDRTRRLLVWRDDDGAAAGYAVVRVAESWGGATGRATLAVLDLQATTPASYRELWRHLLADDLVGIVEWENASLDEPLPWLLADARAVELGAARDMLWLRVLDVAALLRARRYTVSDRFRFRVLDPVVGPTGGPGAGRFVLDTTDPVAPAVERLPAGTEVDAVLPAPSFGSVVLGGADPRVLARAGRLEETSPGAAGRLARLLAAPTVPWNGVRF